MSLVRAMSSSRSAGLLRAILSVWLHGVHRNARACQECLLKPVDHRLAGPYDPNDPNGPPPQPPSAWQHMLHVVGGIMHFFGRLSFLVDENAHAVHFFVSALLQLLDR